MVEDLNASTTGTHFNLTGDITFARPRTARGSVAQMRLHFTRRRRGTVRGLGLGLPHVDGNGRQGLVAVTPARRRLGLGTDLLVLLLNAAANRGLRSVACTLGSDTRPARRLCRSLGLPPMIVTAGQRAGTIAIPVVLGT